MAWTGHWQEKTGRAHSGGSLVDIVADQLGVVVLPMAAVYHFGIDGVVAVLFSTAYVVFIVFAVYANEKLSIFQVMSG